MPAANAKTKEGGGLSLVAILILTVLGAGAGSFFGMQIPHLAGGGTGETGAAKQAHLSAHDKVEGAQIRVLPPITTNLANPPNTWIRLETAVLIREEVTPEIDAIVAKLPEDIVAYLRTLPLAQIEGPSGFQHLREDLNDRVRVRSKGKISELIVQALVVE